MYPTGRMREGGAVPLEVVFMFPGVAEHYVGMGRGLYDAEAVFRHHFDRCAAVLRPISDIALRARLYPDRGSQPQEEHGTSPVGEIDLRALMGRAQTRTTADAGRSWRVTITHPSLFA